MHAEQAEPEGIGQRLRLWRVRRDLNQTELAVLVGTTQSTISRIESGRKPRPAIAGRLETLLSGEDPGRNKVGEEVIEIIARSSELRALIERIAKAL